MITKNSQKICKDEKRSDVRRKEMIVEERSNRKHCLLLQLSLCEQVLPMIKDLKSVCAANELYNFI